MWDKRIAALYCELEKARVLDLLDIPLEFMYLKGHINRNKMSF